MLSDLMEDICIIVEKDLEKEEIRKELRKLIWYYADCSVEAYIEKRRNRHKMFEEYLRR